MPRVSHNKLNDKKLEEIKEHFSYLISSLNDKKEVENFLENFLTAKKK